MSINQAIKISIACVTTALVTTGCIDMTSDENYKVGKFIDSPVVGLSYKTDSLEGRTNIAGEFKYIDGEYVLFSIGDISLPLTIAQPIVTPLNLADTNDPTNTEVVNILRLLQTLDKDADPSNGIEISQEAHIAGKGVTLDLGSEDFASSEDTRQFLQAALGDGAILIDETEAIEHFRASLSLTEEAPENGFSASELNNQTYYLVTDENLSGTKTSAKIDNVYFASNRFEYFKDDTLYKGAYAINNGILQLKYDLTEKTSDTYISIVETESDHLATCWADTPLGSLECEKQNYTRFFTNSNLASSFVDSINDNTADNGVNTSTDNETTENAATDATDSENSSTVVTSNNSDTGSTTDTSNNSDTGSTTDTSNNSDTGSTTDTSNNSDSGSTTDTSNNSNTSNSTDTSNTSSANTDTISTSNNTSTDNSQTDSAKDVTTDSDTNDTDSYVDSTDSNEPSLGAAGSTGTKFNPGHYIFTNISRRYSKSERGTRRIEFIKKYINSPNIKGFVGTYDWKYLEPFKNNYDFDNIREILKMLEGTDKQYALYIKERSFSGSCTKPPVPDYLMGYKYKYSGYVCMIKLYHEDVMDRQIALFQALGDEFDDHPNLEFISTGETTIGGSDGYSGEVWTNQLIRFFQESKTSLQHTVINIQMNFLESGTEYMDRIAAAMAKTGGGGLGLPDTVPCRRTDIPSSEVCGYTIPGYDVLRKYNGKLAIMPDVETWDLMYEQTPEILDMAVDYLGSTHVVWQSEFSSREDSRGYVPNYLENQVIPTVDSQGGRIQDTCPSALAPCL